MGTQIPNMSSYQDMVKNPSQLVEFNKGSVTVVAGREYTLWRATGFPSPGLGFYGTTPVTCTSATVGALPFINSTNTQRIVPHPEHEPPAHYWVGVITAARRNTDV